VSGAGDPAPGEASLVRMANQTAANVTGTDPSEAAGAVAAHLRTFWSPVMRGDLARLAAQGQAPLRPEVLAALALLAAPA